MDQFLEASLRLHSYIQAHHWNGHALLGPDPGIRFNYRIGRFVKGYLPFVGWRDDLYYVQGQGYWILANEALFDRTSEERYAEIAERCADELLAQQRADGAWEYPNPEWAGRIATAEGTWGSIGLLATYRRTGEPRFLDGALRWHDFLQREIGFQRIGDELAVNYFAGRPGARVPNNTAFLLRFLAMLDSVTGTTRYTKDGPDLVAFMRSVQRPSGEFPYAVPGTDTGGERPHFQCYQYNAFQCLDLIAYHELTGDDQVIPAIEGVLRFLKGGIGDDGHAAYDCTNPRRTVTYHTAALAAAFNAATALNIDTYRECADRAYAYVLRLQRPDGGFIYSQRDYRLFSDRRSYPRYLAMILYHLLLADRYTPARPQARERRERTATCAEQRCE